jgi:guanylate kinase
MQIRRRGALVVVSAPSGAGKTTLCEAVRARVPNLFYSISYTTRAPRPGEVDGKDFHFVPEAEFVAMREQGEFAEWAVVHGHSYGTPAGPLEAALGRGEDVLLDIDTQGARQLRARYAEAVSVFVMAPSLHDLEARLRERKSDAPEEITRRLARARAEMAAWRQYDYLIINRHVAEAVERLATIIQGERWRTSRLTITFPDMEVLD